MRLLGLDDSGDSPFDESWHTDVLEDHILLSEYGDDLRDRPEAKRQAHLAILAGKAEKRREQNEKTEREGKKTRRQANSSQLT